MNESLFADLLKDQYAAVLAMLTEAIRRCPPAAWATADPHPFWREARHTAYYIDFYLAPSPDGFRDPKNLGRDPHAIGPAEGPPCDRGQLLAYVEDVAERVDTAVARHARTGFGGKNPFWWTGPTPAHRLVYNLRHAQHHLGILNTILRANGVDPGPWLINRPEPEEKDAG